MTYFPTVTISGDVSTEITDGYGFEAECTPMDELRVAQPMRLVGTTFSAPTTGANALDTNFWTATTAGGGSAYISGAQAHLDLSAVTGSSASFESVRTARYAGGAANRYRAQLQIPDSGYAGNVRRWGAYNANDGCFFMLSGTDFCIGTRRSGVDEVVVASAFNVVPSAALTIYNTTWEIYYTNGGAWFVSAGHVLHKVTASANPWTDSMHLPVRAENINVSASSAAPMSVRSATIFRFGPLQTMSQYKNVTASGANNAKIGPGQLHSLTFNLVNTSYTIVVYDSVSAGGTTIGTMTIPPSAAGANNVPFTLTYNIPFFNGLTVSANGAPNITLTYE